MKANELMIGDWVYRPDCYDQVKEIRQNGIIGLDSARGLIPFSELEPIPITIEFLERNKFKIDKVPDYEDLGIEEYHCRLQCKDSRGFDVEMRYKTDYNMAEIFIYTHSSVHSTMDIRMQIKYVHQLQQAARFCKIEMTYE